MAATTVFESTAHLLHGALHLNGYGHLLRMNAGEGSGGLKLVGECSLGSSCSTCQRAAGQLQLLGWCAEEVRDCVMVQWSYMESVGAVVDRVGPGSSCCSQEHTSTMIQSLVAMQASSSC